MAAALSVWIGVGLVVGDDDETSWGGDAEDDDDDVADLIAGGDDIIRLTVSMYHYIEYFLILLRILFV